MGDSNNPLWFNIKKLGVVWLTVKKKHHTKGLKISYGLRQLRFRLRTELLNTVFMSQVKK